MLFSLKKNDKSYLLLLEKHVKCEEELFEALEKGEDARAILEKIYELRKNTIQVCKFSNDKKIEIPEIKKTIDPKLLISYRECKNELEHILKKEIPTINVNILIKFVNLFGKTILNSEHFIPDFEEDGKLATLNTNESHIPLSLKNGKKIVLTNNNFNLSQFTYDELVEILRVLDIVISDNRFDFLRDEIVKQIASISSVSSIQ